MKFLMYLMTGMLLFAACQQETFDDSRDMYNGQLPYVNYVYLYGDTSPFSTTGTYMDSYYSNDNVYFYSDLYLDPGISYTMFFDVNGWGIYLLHSGESDTRNLTVYSRNSMYMPLPMQRPMKVSFNVSASGTYRVSLDVSRMQYDISSGAGIVYQENILNTLHLTSPHSEYSNGFLLNNRLLPSGYSYRVILSNLVPGNPFPFHLVLNSNDFLSLGKEPQNQFTTGNGLLDADVNVPFYAYSDYAWFTPTSEAAILTYNHVSRSFTVSMGSKPGIGDGMFDSTFYNGSVLSNDNPSNLRDIRQVFFRNTGPAWYIAVDGNFSGTNGLPHFDEGIRFVLFIDDTSDGSGISGRGISLYTDLEPVYIPAGRSVEYILVMQNILDSRSASEGVGILKGRRVKLYGPLNMTMSNYNDFQTVEKLIPCYEDKDLTTDIENGFFQYGDIYEIVIPKINLLNGSPILPVESMYVCQASWNAGTVWLNKSNTNHNMPLAYTVPSTASSNTNNLPLMGAWKLVN